MVPAATVQGDFWTKPDSEQSLALMKSLDRLNTDYGRATVRFAVTGMVQGWKLRSDQRSPRYTTEWGELVMVSA